MVSGWGLSHVVAVEILAAARRSCGGVIDDRKDKVAESVALRCLDAHAASRAHRHRGRSRGRAIPCAAAIAFPFPSVSREHFAMLVGGSVDAEAACRDFDLGGLVVHFHVLSFPHCLGVVKGLAKLFCLFFVGGQNCGLQHVPTLPVSSRRESRLLEEDARKRISAVVCDAVSSGLTSAHGGL